MTILEKLSEVVTLVPVKQKDLKVASLSTPMYSGDIRMLLSEGAVSDIDMLKLMRGDVKVIDVDFDKIEWRKRGRLTSSLLKAASHYKAKTMKFVEDGKYVCTELEFARKGFEITIYACYD